MSERVRQLEDALSIMQSKESSEPHPLLRDELLNLKVEKTEELPYDPDDPQEATSMIDAFGTLSMTEKGSSRFFGASGGTEVRIHSHLNRKTLRFVPSVIAHERRRG